MQLEALLNYPRALPAMPRAVTDLLGEMNKEDPSPKRVGALIGNDPALTTRVLRLSNSAFFRVSRKIGSAEEAVAMLGLTHVRSLVMAAAAYNAGAARVDEWLVTYGDPRLPSGPDAREWIELIPFAETRNYVQRVIESTVVYRARDPAALDLPHPLAALLDGRR